MTDTGSTPVSESTTSDSTAAPAGATWTLDPAGSSVVFRSTSLWGLVKVKGTFSGLSGRAEVGPDGTATADFEIDAATVDTGNAKRDTHLRSADFFDVEKNPTITFHVTGVTDGGGTKARLPGTLSVFGQTHPLDVEATIAREGDSALTLTSTTVVDRSARGNGWKKTGMTKFDTPVDVTGSPAFGSLALRVSGCRIYVVPAIELRNATTSARSMERCMGGTRARSAPR